MLLLEYTATNERQWIKKLQLNEWDKMLISILVIFSPWIFVSITTCILYTYGKKGGEWKRESDLAHKLILIYTDMFRIRY